MITEARSVPLTWAILCGLALISRLAAALLLPNAEQDAYCYVEETAQLAAKLGHLRLADLFGFWLPLFQLMAAIPSAWIDHPLMVGKILAALAGSITCVLVFAISFRLTRDIFLAGVAFALILCNPFHILYSAASMTDVPHACLVLVTLWFILQKRWIPAAVFAAFAEGMRLEAWVFVIVLPLLQFACERRLSWRVLMIVLVSPLAWLAISFAATGDAFAYFAKRAVYQAGYFDFYPSRRGFVLADIWQDVNYFLLGANALAVLAIIAAGGLSIFAAFRRSQRLCWPVAAIATCAVAFFAFLLAAYATKRQPVILPRYGMIFFILGLPLLAWLLHLLISNWPGSRAPKFIAALLIAVCLWISWPQVATISKVLDDFRAHRQIAQQLALALHESPDQAWRCFSDDAAVRVLSRLPAQRFLRSETARAEARANAESFKSYLQKNHVVWLVFVRIENSLPAKFLPDLGRSDKIDLGDFQLASVAFSPFGSDVWLYRVRKFD